jgi:hypothetical protein
MCKVIRQLWSFCLLFLFFTTMPPPRPAVVDDGKWNAHFRNNVIPKLSWPSVFEQLDPRLQHWAVTICKQQAISTEMVVLPAIGAIASVAGMRIPAQYGPSQFTNLCTLIVLSAPPNNRKSNGYSLINTAMDSFSRKLQHYLRSVQEYDDSSSTVSGQNRQFAASVVCGRWFLFQATFDGVN